MKNLKFNSSEILDKEELKNISGGQTGNCFDDAILAVEEMEASIGNGVTFGFEDFTYWVNDFYASCVCMERYDPINSVSLYDACWG